MSYFLSSLPLWLLIAIIVVIPTVLAMGAQVLIRKRIGLDKLVNNNEIAGFKFATVGVIYAVLLAFSVIVVWEKFSDAQTSVAEEAGRPALSFTTRRARSRRLWQRGPRSPTTLGPRSKTNGPRWRARRRAPRPSVLSIHCTRQRSPSIGAARGLRPT